jgi:hypothetical protein
MVTAHGLKKWMKNNRNCGRLEFRFSIIIARKRYKEISKKFLIVQGIAYLRSVGMLGDTHKDVAEFLLNCAELSKKQIGDHLG